MNAPEKCPNCRADIKIMSEGGSWRKFRCGTEASSFENEPAEIFQSDVCLKAERDQIAERVKELEPYETICKNPAALWANWLRGTVALPAGIGDVRQEQARVRELEAERNKAVARYEFVRRLTPRQFSELAKDNLSSGIPFDDIVDSRIKWAKP